MPIITIREEYLRRSDVERCIPIVKAIAAGAEIEKRLIIDVSMNLKGFDPTLMAYFLIFNRMVPDLEIEIKLPTGFSNPKVEMSLKQLGTYAFVMTGRNLFCIGGLASSPDKSIDFSFRDLSGKAQVSFPDNWFIFSRELAPALVVLDDRAVMDIAFGSGLAELSAKELKKLPAGISWTEDNDALRADIHETLRLTSRPDRRRLSLINLLKAAFYTCLHEAKALPLYFETAYQSRIEDKSLKLRAGRLEHEEALAYYRSIRPLFDELAERSMLHQLLFSMILSTDALTDEVSGRDELKRDNQENFSTKLYQLWDFTKDFVSGIREMAKNIRDHVVPACGAISIRVFSSQTWHEIQSCDDKSQMGYEGYQRFLIAQLGTLPKSFFDVHIVDLGEIGAVETLRRSTAALLLDPDLAPIHKFLEEDQKSLTNMSFGDLFGQEQMLNQQTKRSIAHFGLLTFDQLISKNLGLLIASSTAAGGEPQIFVNLEEAKGANAIAWGTNYHIVLPIRRAEAYRSHLPHTIIVPSDTTAKELKGMEILLDYTYPGDKMKETSGPRLERFCVPAMEIATRQDEQHLWTTIANGVSQIDHDKPARCLFVLDLEAVTLDESQLFRLLGNWELHIPAIALAIVNIETKDYHKLLGVNDLFASKARTVDYWNVRIATLVYSFIVTKNGRFYFTDVLWGRKYQDFASLNWQVSLTSFNSTVLTDEARVNTAVTTFNGKLRPNTPVAFYNDTCLLPFDLLVTGEGERSLFDHNAAVLLQNEIKVDGI